MLPSERLRRLEVLLVHPGRARSGPRRTWGLVDPAQGASPIRDGSRWPLRSASSGKEGDGHGIHLGSSRPLGELTAGRAADRHQAFGRSKASSTPGDAQGPTPSREWPPKSAAKATFPKGRSAPMVLADGDGAREDFARASAVHPPGWLQDGIKKKPRVAMTELLAVAPAPVHRRFACRNIGHRTCRAGLVGAAGASAG